MPDTNWLTYDLPNYIGEIFMEDKRYPNRTLHLIGALSDAESLDVQGLSLHPHFEFPVAQTYAVPDHQADTSRVEGADAPDATGVVRDQATNVMQIWQEKVIVSYSKEGASQQLSGLNLGGESNPVTSELDFQTNVKLSNMIRNLNWTVINQEYRKPANNTLSRRTRGLIDAVTSTRLENAGTARPLTMALLEDFAEEMLQNGGILDSENVIVAAGTKQLRRLNDLFKADGLEPESRDIRGVRVRTVVTTFATFNFYHEPDVPAGTLVAINFPVVSLRAMPIPGKGVLFREELARTGASLPYQIYGEIGLDHGPEFMHGVLEDLTE